MKNIVIERFRNSMELIRLSLKLSQQKVSDYIGLKSYISISNLENNTGRPGWDEERYNKIRSFFENEIIVQEASKKNVLGVKTAKEIFDMYVDNYDDYSDDQRKILKIRVMNNFSKIDKKTAWKHW